MKLSKASEILTLHLELLLHARVPDLRDAINLGREALNRLQEQRSGTILDEYDLLPGEDPE